MTNPSVHIIGTRGYPSFYGGFETLVRCLAPYLADQGWDVTVYGRGRTADAGKADGDSRIRSIDTIGVESKSLSTLSYGLTSTAHCAYTKPDVALVMNVANGFWLPLLRARGIPTLVNVDGIEWERAKWGNAAKKLFRAGATATARHADNLVFDSKALGARWSDEFNRTGEFIPYGGSFGKDRPVVEGLTRRGYVLMVARFVPENTVEEFLEAAVQLSERWDVVVVGSTGYGGELEDRLTALTQRNPRVRWFGHVSDDGCSSRCGRTVASTSTDTAWGARTLLWYRLWHSARPLSLGTQSSIARYSKRQAYLLSPNHERYLQVFKR